MAPFLMVSSAILIAMYFCARSGYCVYIQKSVSSATHKVQPQIWTFSDVAFLPSAY